MALVLERRAGFVLTKRSVIMCPHGGMVMHSPTSFSGELVNGEIPMLINDVYTIVGCPNSMGGAASACMTVIWTTASTSYFINGVPVLIHTSVGLCQSSSGVPQGPAIVASFQTVVMD